MPQYFLHDFSPFLFEFREGVGLRWYGLSYVLSFVLGGWLYRWLARRGYTDLPEAQVGDFITWAAVFGVMIGGRVGWLIFYGWRENHADDPWWWPLEVWKGGMASHGGILGLVFFTLYWARMKKVSWTSIGDCLVVVAPIGMLLVRLANFINGELYGRAAGVPGGKASVPWAMLFPKELGAGEPPLAAIQHDPIQRDLLREILTPRHPSQLYEALLEGVVLFAVLWVLRTRCRLPRGVITGVFFILYAILRIVGEFFREPDPAWAVGWISAGQFLSLFMVFIGAGFLVWGWRRREYERVFALTGTIS
ncbi:MAG: prolipoprotein diacylglyceryl transferase [Chthoniobacter sp.]|nr:prolipoprotein diacylglyceryl transferase [Chthoniobacter sp.]